MSARYDITEGIGVAMAELSDQQRFVLRLRFIENISIDLTAKAVGESIERTRKIEAAGVAKIRANHPELAELLQ